MDIRKLRRQAKIEEWRKIILDRYASGLTIREYCSTRGIGRNQYLYWLRIVRNAEAESSLAITGSKGTCELVEISPANIRDDNRQGPTDCVSVSPSLALEVSGVTIRIDSSTSPELLKMALEVVRNA